MATLSPERNESLLNRLLPFLVPVWLVLFWTVFFTSELPNASTPREPLDRLTLLLVMPEIYGGLFDRSGASPESSSWINLAERIDVLAVALLIVTGAFATGRLILRLLSLWNCLLPADRNALAGGLGFSAVSLVVLGFGLAGILNRPLFILMFFAASAAEIFLTLRSRRTENISPTEENLSQKAPVWLKWGVLLICVPYVSCMLLGSMLPPTDFDVKEYHLGGPKEYFLAGRIHFLPHDVYTSFPFLTEMLSLAGMVVRGDWERGAYAGQAVLMFFAPLAALGCYCVARRAMGEIAGWLAVLVYLTIPWTYRISIIAYTEGALCCYVVLSLLAFQNWLELVKVDGESSRSVWRETFVLGLLAGSAVSTKYPGMVLVAIPFAIAIAVALLRLLERHPVRLVQLLVVYGAGVLISFGPWMAKNLAETGNPVYPLMYGVFGGVDWDEAMHRKWQAAHPPGLLKGSWEDFAGVIYKNDWQSPLLFAFAPLAFLRRGRWTGLIAGYAAMLLLAWYILTHRIDRFWVPMNSVMAVLAGCGLAAVLNIFPAPFAARPQNSGRKLRSGKETLKDQQTEQSPAVNRFGTLIARFLLVFAVVYNFGFITTPMAGYNAYLSSYAEAQEQTKTMSVKIIDWLKLPPGSKVLFVGEAELFNAHFPYAYNTVFDKSLLEEWTSDRQPDGEWSFKAPAEILQKFHSEGVSYVFINWNEILRYRTTYTYTDFVNPERIEQLVQLGVLTPVPLPDSIAYRDWERVSPSWQSEVERWAPSLRMADGDKQVLLQYQCFAVTSE